jgi:multidrug efflux pump subunit AcrA (membrane-fusion protein)
MTGDWSDLSQAPASDSGPAIEDIVDDLARLARAELTPAAFFSALLEQAVHALVAPGAAVWQQAASGSFRRQQEVPRGGELWPAIDPPWHAQLLADILAAGQPRLLPPDDWNPGARGANPGPNLLLLAPWSVEGQSPGVLEIILRPQADPAAWQGYTQFAAALAELIADYHRQRQLRELSARQAMWGRLEQFVRRVHAHLDVDATAYEIANEGRLIIGCDQLSVAIWDEQSSRLRATSGLEGFDPRANVVRRSEQLLDALLAEGTRSWWTPDDAPLSPSVSICLQAYLDATHVRQVAIVPLLGLAADRDGQPELLGALVLDRFDGEPLGETCRQRATVVAEHAALALRAALAQQRLPLSGLGRWLQRWAGIGRRSRRRVAAALAVLAAVVLGLLVIPADFTIEAHGTLEPAARREVFASADGIVDEIRVEHGSRVDQGQTLVVLRRPQLEFEASRVAGELQTSRKRLASVQASRLSTSASDAVALERYNQLTAEEEELKESLRGLEQQEQVLRAQQEELTLRSPLAGQVLTWDVEQLLAARPVQRGQALLTVADVDGPWILELRVPDDQAGYLLDAQRALGHELAVSFLLSTRPQQAYQGKVERVAMVTDLDDDDQPMVLTTVAIDRREVAPLRPRTSVVGKVHCGSRSLGYVWLHGLWHALQSWWNF